jgi:hypothetical protein
VPTLKALETLLVEALKMAESNVEQILVNARMALMVILQVHS